MKATTAKTLTALAEAGEQGSVRLPLDPEIYPSASQAAAAEAFSELCSLRRLPHGQVAISFHGQNRKSGRRIIRELLNFMLDHAWRQRAGGVETA